MTATATVQQGTVSGADPMGAAGAPTDVAQIKRESTITTDVTSEAAKKKSRGPKAPDDDAPRRTDLVTATFAEAEKAKMFVHDEKGKNTNVEITDEAKLKEARRNKACDTLLLKAEGKEGVKFKSSDFKKVSDYFGGAKSYFYMRKRYYTSKAQEMQDKIDGKTSSDPMAIAKKAQKAKAELDKLMKELGGLDLDLSALGLG